MNKFLCALLLALAGNAVQAAEASEAQWIAAAEKAVAFGRANGLAIALQVEQGNGLSGHTPIGIWNEAGRCTLVVSAAGNPTAARVTELVDTALLDIFLEGAAIHEVGHCYRRLHGYPANEKPLPIVAWIAPVRAWFVQRIRTEEVFADLTEVAWLARYYPTQYKAVVGEIVKVRTRFREPKHDTLAWLEIAQAEGPTDAPGDVFLQADKRLSRYPM
jgi:hypothetical protein